VTETATPVSWPASHLELAQHAAEAEQTGVVVEVQAGQIPAYYGADATSSDVCQAWLYMAERCANFPPPQDPWFYLANAIGWASRP